ncbi:MAG: hypothetical protein HY465_01095 [Deltaproteobacteria bacterium]|nr:hypothetical protein [Deltaproteobacteria bacterium]
MYVLLLCLGYFVSYTVYGIAIKYFIQVEHMPGMELLYHSTIGGIFTAMLIAVIGRWPQRLKSTSSQRLWGLFPAEYAWLIPSGLCTAFVIPTTSLMYTFGFNIMVAMIIMRSSLIVISRGVDAVLIYQGHSDKKVYWQENVAALIAIAALSTVLMEGGKPGTFDFFHSTLFMANLGCYIIPYGFRLYILSRFKTKIDSRAIFGIEQVWAFSACIVGILLTILAFTQFGFAPKQVEEFAYGFFNPNFKAMAWSIPYGLVAVFSVFLFIYKFGSATFNTIVNRLTSLLAGTAASVASFYYLGGKPVAAHEWKALGVVLLAITFLVWADRRRHAEKKRTVTSSNPAFSSGAAMPVGATLRQ